ncbi:MAG: class I SAM-dependent methyltransferase [Ktedonobacteraceae bacterium]|nr:class I SAM-dependent methyltransferase [Ktedonobacteraceae bacterium]MBO0790793.1 class I SAM-dependent methyltransferase [Ktedonobacteraceae bacterium]
MVENDWNSQLYDQQHAFIFQYGRGVLELLKPQPGETIVDLGCGTGHLTKAIAEAGAHAIGLDASLNMIAQAQATYPQIEFHQADARNFTVATPVDAVFSNAMLHWVSEAESVAESISKALKPGGRFVAEFGGKGNCAETLTTLRTALRELSGHEIENDWYFVSIGEYSPLLERHGLLVRRAELFDRPTKLDGGEQGLRNWIEMFCGRMFQQVKDNVKEQAIVRTEQQLRSEFFREDSWYINYRRLRVVALKETLP